jgi:hypothetical protein
MVRARFTALATSVCWRRERPVMRRDRILPRSLTKRLSDG